MIKFQYKKIKNQNGQSLIELVVAMMIFTLIISSVISIGLGRGQSIELGSEFIEAERLADSSLEIIKSIKNASWNDLDFGQGVIASSSIGWNFVLSNELEEIGKFERKVLIREVCRDDNYETIDCSLGERDLNSKEVEIEISWPALSVGEFNSVKRKAMLTNWDSRKWTQTNWSGGAGQTNWGDKEKFLQSSNMDFSSFGEIKLEKIEQDCGTKRWKFSNPSDYIFNEEKIRIENGIAKLATQSVDDWWDNDYQYRKRITILNNSSNVLGDKYSIKLNLNHYALVQAGKSQADGDDIRVVYQEGGSKIELDRVNESSWNNNLADTEIWFSLPFEIQALGDDANFFIYYGNSSTSNAPSDRSKIYLLYDDFETGNLSEWTELGPDQDDKFSISSDRKKSGQYSLKVNPVYYETRLFLRNNFDESDVLVESFWQSDSSVFDFSQSVRVQNVYPITDYEAEYEGSNTWSIAKQINGAWSRMDYAYSSFPINNWIKIESIIQGTKMKLIKDNVQIVPNNDWLDVGSQISSGSIGFSLWNVPSSIWIDDLKVRRFTYPEPSVVLGEEEQSDQFFSTDYPTIEPVIFHSSLSVDAWSKFEEVVTKTNGGQTYYQLSVDNGQTWLYWNGYFWDLADLNDYNLVSEINNGIGELATTSSQVKFKVFLASDGLGQVELSEVSLSCEKQFTWDFDEVASYEFDANEITIENSFAKLKASGGGEIEGIEDAVVSSYVSDNGSGKHLDFIQIADEVYLIAYSGDGNDGFIETIRIDDNGVILNSRIDILEFDTSEAQYSQIINLSGNIYAIAYQGGRSDGWIATVNIDNNGIISNSIIDKYEFDNRDGRIPDIIKISNNVVAIAYQGRSSDGWLKTISISDSGVINGTISAFEFDNKDGREVEIGRVDNNIFMLAYRGVSGDAYIKTLRIDSDGSIAANIIDELEYDTSYGAYPEIINISENIYALFYEGGGQDAWVKTISISSNGFISNSIIDFLEFDNIQGRYPDVIKVDQDKYIVAYTNSSSQLVLKMIQIDENGIIVQVMDELLVSNQQGIYPTILSLPGAKFAVAYQSNNIKAKVSVFELTLSSSQYPDYSPSIKNSESLLLGEIGAFNGFFEVSNKNSGEIYYQLSDDKGLIWKYWDGNSWVNAGLADYNTALEVNDSIKQFSTSTKKIMFKAFLASSGSDQVELDSVRISWGEIESANQFKASAFLESSFFDAQNNSVFQTLEWVSSEDSCENTCETRVQLRVAEDSNGSPSTWSAWYEVPIFSIFGEKKQGVLTNIFKNKQWLQYRIELNGDGSETPVFQHLEITYK